MRRSFTGLLAIGAVSALLTFSPPAAHAIPVAGDYVFTSGLTGTFTSNGTQLTAWAIQDLHEPTLIWSDITPTSQNVLINSVGDFQIEFIQSSQKRLMTLFWASSHITDTFNNSSCIPNSVVCQTARGPMTFEAAPTTSVPEPSGVVLQGLALGVLALIGYVRRQQRRAGLQVE